MRSRSPSCASTVAVPSEPGASTPMRVIVARLRTSAVIGMSSSSACHTSGEARCSARQSLARQAVVADELRHAGRRLRRLGEREALDDPRQAVRRAAPDDPLEQAAVLVAQLERRVAGAHATGRVSETQHVAVGHAVSLPVLDRLVGERLRRAIGVPAADRAPQRAAPAAEALDEGHELEQVRRCAAHPRQRLERRAPRRLVAETCSDREREDRRIVLRCPARLADLDDLGNGAEAVGSRTSARPPSRSRVSASTHRRSSCRPPSRGSGSGAAAPSSSTAHAKPPALFATWLEPGIGADCGARCLLRRFR